MATTKRTKTAKTVDLFGEAQAAAFVPMEAPAPVAATPAVEPVVVAPEPAPAAPAVAERDWGFGPSLGQAKGLKWALRGHGFDFAFDPPAEGADPKAILQGQRDWLAKHGVSFAAASEALGVHHGAGFPSAEGLLEALGLTAAMVRAFTKAEKTAKAEAKAAKAKAAAKAAPKGLDGFTAPSAAASTASSAASVFAAVDRLVAAGFTPEQARKAVLALG